MMYVSIIKFTYSILYGGMMRGKYYINITLRVLHFHLTLYRYCTNIIIITCIKPALFTI